MLEGFLPPLVTMETIVCVSMVSFVLMCPQCSGYHCTSKMFYCYCYCYRISQN